jgi:hypothetical protein
VPGVVLAQGLKHLGHEVEHSPASCVCGARITDDIAPTYHGYWNSCIASDAAYTAIFMYVGKVAESDC